MEKSPEVPLSSGVSSLSEKRRRMMSFPVEVLGLPSLLAGGLSFRLIQISGDNGVSESRHVLVPNAAMRQVHESIRNWVEGLTAIYNQTATYRPCISEKDSVLRHRYGRLFYILHIKEALQSVDSDKLFDILWELDPEMRRHSREAKPFLLAHCFVPPTGLVGISPAARALLKLYYAVLVDCEIAALCERVGLNTFTRFGDVIVVSCKQRHLLTPRVQVEIRAILKKAGFDKLNHARTGIRDLVRKDIHFRLWALQWQGGEQSAKIFISPAPVARAEQVSDGVWSQIAKEVGVMADTFRRLLTRR